MVRTPQRFARLAATIVVLASTTASAQETITLDRAIQGALAQNASLRAARATVAERTANVGEARSGWFPRISATETWQRGDQPVFVFSSLLSARRFGAANFAIDALNHPDPIGFFRASVAVEQVLFDGGLQRSAVERAERGREISEATLDQASADVVLATVQMYGRILAAEAGDRAAASALESAREDLGRARHRRDAGVATEADVLALIAHAADLEQRAIQRRGDAGVARAELNRLMGAPVGHEYQVVHPLAAAAAQLGTAGLEALLAEADRSRPELRRVAAARRLADAERKGAGAALAPQIAAQAAFDVSGTSIDNRASAWLVGAELRWNLSLGGAERARMKAAVDARARADAEAEDVRAAVHVEVVSALRRLESANARQAAGRAAVDQARESQRITRDRFEAGLAGVTDVLRASSAVMDAEAQRVSSAVDAMVSEAMLHRALGRHP